MTAPTSGWLRGIVKEVISGDTIVIMAASKAGIPPEKRLTLSSLMAPKLVRLTCFVLLLEFVDKKPYIYYQDSELCIEVEQRRAIVLL
jgi:hypothetical protein